MKRQLLYKILFILLLPIHLFAQPNPSAERDITGLWKGSLYNDTTKKYLPYEIAISEERGKLSGYSYTLFDIDGKKEIGVKSIKIKRKGDQLIIEDVELISNNYSEPPPRKVRQLSVVNLLVNDTALILTGNWSTNRTKEYNPLTGSLQVQRSLDYKPLALYKKLEELNLDHDLSFVKTANQRQADLAVNNKPPTEIKSIVPATSPSADVDKAKESAVPLTDKVVVATNESAKKQTIPPEKAIVKAPVDDKPQPIIVPVTENKKEVVVTANQSKKENIQPAPEKSKPITPEPPAKKTEPVATVKEPVKKEVKPMAETGKKPVTTEKSTVIVAAEINNKTVPVASLNKPVKTENKIAADLITSPAQKKEAAVVVVAPIVPVAAANVAERKMNNEQAVYFESDSLQLTLYDNGDVDGDTVSVLMNGQIIFAKQGLSTKANTKTIYTGNGMPDSLSMVMYAENLGSIPPNTGLLVIMDGEKRYEVRFSADLKTNAAILLKRIKKEK